MPEKALTPDEQAVIDSYRRLQSKTARRMARESLKHQADMEEELRRETD